MYSKQESAQLKEEFWSAFGKYMAPALSAEGENVNWVNYKTGEKHISFRMQTAYNEAIVSMEFTHPEITIQQLYYEQAIVLKKFLDEASDEAWNWEAQIQDEHGKIYSRTYKRLTGVSILNRSQWPLLISFFKESIISLDRFWSTVKYSFEALR